MGRIRLHLFLWTSLFVGVGVTAGCSNAGVSPDITITPSQVVLSPGQTIQFGQSGLNGQVTWAVDGLEGGSPASGTITSSGLYTAPAASNVASVQITAHAGARATVFGVASVSLVSPRNFIPGVVLATNNPQVARYTVSAPQNSSVQIAFGLTNAYGLTTWSEPAPTSGGPVSILVAGMRTNSTYHMQAIVLGADGTRIVDSDHVFTTGGEFPANEAAVQGSQNVVSTPSGLPPQPGVELLALTGAQPTAVATDLEGNVIWSYTDEGADGEFTQPLKMLSNGDVLMVIGPNSSLPAPPGFLNVAREINLAGDTIREIAVSTLNSRLAAGNFNLVVNYFHHDIVALPNGHWLCLVNPNKEFPNLPGYPGTTTALGDAIVDLDTNLQPVWV